MEQQTVEIPSVVVKFLYSTALLQNKVHNRRANLLSSAALGIPLKLSKADNSGTGKRCA